MALRRGPAIFGSTRRTEVLVLLALAGESYPREMARVLNAPLISVQTIVDGLESAGLTTSRLVGNQRRVSLNPRFYGIRELQALLLRIAEAFPEIGLSVDTLRRRPRRRGKRI
jgi:DNA-binding transcriptional ArsR family regulator